MSLNAVPSELPLPPGQQTLRPPRDLYEFLGLAPFESDREAISAKVRDLMREARKYQLGPYAARSQAQLEALASASARLLDPIRKREYDDELRRSYGLPEVSTASTFVPRPSGAADSSREKSTPGVGRSSRRRLLAVGLVALGLAFGYRFSRLNHQERAGPANGSAIAGGGRDHQTPPAGAVARRDANGMEHAARGETSRAIPEAPAHEADVESTPVRSPDEPVAGQVAAAPPGRAPVIPEAAGTIAPEPVAVPAIAEATTPRPHMPPEVRPDRPIPASGGSRVGGGRPQSREDLNLSAVEVLRELRDFRLKRSPAQRMSGAPHALGTARIVALVRYGRTAYRDDRRFQRQLDQETTALRRLDPRLRDLLPDAPR